MSAPRDIVGIVDVLTIADEAVRSVETAIATLNDDGDAAMLRRAGALAVDVKDRSDQIQKCIRHLLLQRGGQ